MRTSVADRLLKQYANMRGGKVMQVAPDTYLMLYPISTLAFECGRTPVTIRHWERNGKFPKAPYLDSSTHRMYAKEHIAVTVALVLQEQLAPGKNMDNSKFTKRAAEAFAALTLDRLKKCDADGKELS